jgi:CheY-like chemotaxis protein
MADAPALRLLVIEDNPVLRDNLAALFARHGIDAGFAADGLSGLQAALDDLRVPDEDILGPNCQGETLRAGDLRTIAASPAAPTRSRAAVSTLPQLEMSCS